MLCGLLGDKSYTHGEFALHKHPPARLAREVEIPASPFQGNVKATKTGATRNPGA